MLSKFPEICQNSYINYKALPDNVGKRLDIMLNDWLKVEQTKQLVLEDLRGDVKVEVKDTN